jgi:hypothetical protein
LAAPPVLDDPSPLVAALRSVTTIASRHRRLLASVCAGGAVVVTVSGLTPQAGASSSSDPGRMAVPGLLPAAAGNLPAGDADRVAVAVRLADPAGLLLLRAGSHAELLAGPAADVTGVPAAPGSATGVVPGTSAGEVLVTDAVVLVVPQPPMTGSVAASGAAVSGLLGSSGAGGGSAGLEGVVVLAVPPSDARRIAAAAGTRPLSVAVALAPHP